MKEWARVTKSMIDNSRITDRQFKEILKQFKFLKTLKQLSDLDKAFMKRY